MTPKPSSKRRQSRGVQEEISKSKPEVKPSQKPEVETKSEEKSRNILLSQDSDIQEGHILLRIPSQQSLDDKPEVDRKSDCKPDVKKKRMTQDEEKNEMQKGNFHKNYREIMNDEISKFFRVLLIGH